MILRRVLAAASVCRRAHLPALVLIMCMVTACAREWGESAKSDTPASAAARDTLPTDSARRVAVPVPAKALPPLADSIAGRLVFVPTSQQLFVAAARKKRLLLDIGRVDDEVNKSPARLAAFKTAVAARSPVRLDDRFLLRGPWGVDTARISGFDVHNGRIVALVKTAGRVDSLAARGDSLAALAVRADSGGLPADSPCDAALSDTLRQRAAALRDSVEKVLRTAPGPAYARLQSSLKFRSSLVGGCFAGGRALLQVTLYGGDYEWVRERVLLITETGGAKPVKVSDFRFKAHELLDAFDADADSVDDVAARGYGVRSGGTVVLKLTKELRLERVAAGFAWER